MSTNLENSIIGRKRQSDGCLLIAIFFHLERRLKYIIKLVRRGSGLPLRKGLSLEEDVYLGFYCNVPSAVLSIARHIYAK